MDTGEDVLLDKGGAMFHQRQQMRAEAGRDELVDQATAEFHQSQTGPLRVSFEIVETHDGDECPCLDDVKTTTLGVGDVLELTHTCHDGRVDKVIAKITAIE